MGENAHHFFHRLVILTLYNHALTSILFSYVVLVLLFSSGLYNQSFYFNFILTLGAITLLGIGAQSGPLWNFFLMSPIYLMLCAYLLQEGIDSQKCNKFIIFIALLMVCIIITFIQIN